MTIEIKEQELDFGDVIKGLKQDKKYARAYWVETNSYIYSNDPDQHSISMVNLLGDNQWTPAPIDMFANDWHEVVAT